MYLLYSSILEEDVKRMNMLLWLIIWLSINVVAAMNEREKGRDLTQSYDKSPYTNRNVKRAK